MDQQLAESAAPKADLDQDFFAPHIKTEIPIVIKPAVDEDYDKKQSTGETFEGLELIVPKRAVRENLVQTAVSFLRNPKTSRAADSDKKSFLLKKGLTLDEIEQAFVTSAMDDSFEASESLFDSRRLITNESQFEQTGVSRSRTGTLSVAAMIGQFSFAVSLLGGLAWGLYHVIKSYLVPLFQTSRQIEKRLKKQDNTLHQMSLTLEAINSQLGSAGSQGNPSKSEDYKEVLQELKSLKRILLNKDNFPPPPKVEPIPESWKVGYQLRNQSGINGFHNGTSGHPDDGQVTSNDSNAGERLERSADESSEQNARKEVQENGFHDDNEDNTDT